MIRITPWKYADSLTEWPFEQDDKDKDGDKKHKDIEVNLVIRCFFNS